MTRSIAAPTEIGAQATEFLYDGLSVVQEPIGGSPAANLVSGLGLDEVFAGTHAVSTSTMLAGALGSTGAVTVAAGTVHTQYTYVRSVFGTL